MHSSAITAPREVAELSNASVAARGFATRFCDSVTLRIASVYFGGAVLHLCAELAGGNFDSLPGR